MHKFTVKRSEWLRGKGSDRSKLFREFDGKRCCVGFYGNSLGYSDEELLDKGAALETQDRSRWPEWVLSSNDCHINNVGQIYSTNDSTLISDEKREEVLKELFLINDVDVQFID